MLSWSSTTDIYLALEPVDFRKSHDGLYAIVRYSFRCDPVSGSVFVFFNRRRDRVKILAWDKNGFWLHYIRKHYETPQTPCARLLASTEISEASKERLRAVLASLDPLRLLDEIRSMQRHIAGLGRGEQAHTPPQRHADLERFLASLATAWMDGEVRPTHRAKPTAARYWRTRQDPFEEVWPKVLVWLESEPDHTAKNSSSDCVRSTQVRSARASYEPCNGE